MYWLLYKNKHKNSSNAQKLIKDLIKLLKQQKIKHLQRKKCQKLKSKLNQSNKNNFTTYVKTSGDITDGSSTELVDD